METVKFQSLKLKKLKKIGLFKVATIKTRTHIFKVKKKKIKMIIKLKMK